MNILHFCWRGPGHPRAGGAELVTHEHSKAWVKAGHSVTLFTSSFPGSKDEETVDGVLVKRKGRDTSFTVIFYGIIWYLFENKSKFDLVIDHFHGLPFFTPIFVRSKKIAFIHEVAREVWKFNPYTYPLNKVIEYCGYVFEPVIIFVIYFFTKFITVSDSTKKALVDWGVASKNVEIVHNGVSVEKPLKVSDKEKSKTLVYLGAITQDKGIEDAIKVYKILSKKDKDIKFWVLGKGEKDYVDKMKGETKEDNNVKFWGFVDQKIKFELLSRAHLLINPSKLEGWGLVVIEAAAMGTPTVGYKVPGLVDSVKNNVTGVLVDKDVNKMADAIFRVLNDSVRYKHMSGNCIKWSKKFNWEISTKKSLQIIESMLESKKS